MIDAAEHASPASARYPRLRAEFESRLPQPDLEAAVEAYQRVIALDPNDTSARLDLAEVLERMDLRAEALEQYQHALRLNGLLNPDEPERLPPSKLEEIRRKILTLGP
jgi:tetratricopeptide (TPR) repeat protein